MLQIFRTPRGGHAFAVIAIAALVASCGDDDVTQPADPTNSRPVADAGPDTSAALADTVTLDGSASRDPDGDPITYRWSLLMVPGGSAATLSDSTAARPTFVADAVGEFVTHLVVSDGTLESVPDTVSVQVTLLPGITVLAQTVGAGLQQAGGATLGRSDHGGVTVRVESDDAAVALIAPDASTAGSAFIDVAVGDGNDAVAYVVQAVAGVTGTATITASAPGFNDGAGTLTVVQPGVAMSGLEDNQSVGTDDAFTVFTGLPDGGGTGLSSFQGVSAASAPLTLTVSSSNGVVGHVATGGDTAATVMRDLAAGEFQFGITFVPRAAGATTVSASIPGFVSTPDATQQVAVDQPGISPFSRTIGAGLQFSSTAGLDISDHGGVTVRIESGDPAVALVAPNANTPGSAFIDVIVPNGSASAAYTVQGVAGTTGTVTVTASAPGFADGTGTITVVQSGLAMFALADTQSVGTNDAFVILLGIPNATGTGLSGFQGVSAASAPLTLTVSSSNGVVAHLSTGGTTAATVMRDLAAGEFQPSITFVPLAAGATTVSASIPGFLSTTAATQAITVHPPNVSPFQRTIGAGLQVAGNATLDISNHGGVIVRIESGVPGVVLIAPDDTTAGSAFIDVFVPDGEDRAPYVVQGVLGASAIVAVTASAPGFTSGTAPVGVVQAGIAFSSIADTLSVGTDDVFTVFTGVPNGTGSALISFQGMSAANVPPLVLTVTSSDGSVGQLIADGPPADSVMVELTPGTFQRNVTFTPLAAGVTVVSATIPDFLTTTSAIRPVVVKDP